MLCHSEQNIYYILDEIKKILDLISVDMECLNDYVESNKEEIEDCFSIIYKINHHMKGESIYAYNDVLIRLTKLENKIDQLI